MGVTIFASITAAVIISTLIIMTLMRGEIAGALSSHVQTNTPTVQTTGACVVPANEVYADASQPVSADMPATSAGVSFVSGVHHMLPAAHNSFNNTSTTTTTNNVTNIEVHNKTIINDSYNNDNDTITVVKDNTVNVNSNNKTIDSNNTVKTNVIGNTVNSNSNNTSNTTTNTTTTTNNVIGNTTNVASNNTVNSNSNNTVTKTTNVVENHLLSDNVTVIVPSV